MTATHGLKIEDRLGDKRDEILRIATFHGALNVCMFGSVARHEATAESDIDLLIDVGPHTTPWFPGDLIMGLQALRGRRIDIATAPVLRNKIRQRVLREAVSV